MRQSFQEEQSIFSSGSIASSSDDASLYLYQHGRYGLRKVCTKQPIGSLHVKTYDEDESDNETSVQENDTVEALSLTSFFYWMIGASGETYPPKTTRRKKNK